MIKLITGIALMLLGVALIVYLILDSNMSPIARLVCGGGNVFWGILGWGLIQDYRLDRRYYRRSRS